MIKNSGYLPHIWEKVFILFFTSIYLYFFNLTIPHGDALRISRQMDAGILMWNPNHLLLDPFGYYWHAFLQTSGLSITHLNSFELISGISTLISLLIFHKILVLIDVKRPLIRLMAIIGLFASKNFLSMAVSQYFFMLQMPFLLGSLYYAIRFYLDTKKSCDSSTSLYAMGLLMAIATGIEINNVITVFFTGIAMGLISTTEKPWDFNNSLKFWGASAVLGFSIFLSGYFSSETESGFITWLLAYQGQTASSLDNYYGTQINLQSILSSGATLLFHFLFGNFIETAGLGTVLKVMVLQQPLEFVPDLTKLIIAGLLMPLVGIGLLLLSIWAVRRVRTNFVIRLLVLWIASYLVFNFFWPYTSDLFWFQMLPFIWLLLIIQLGETNVYNDTTSSTSKFKRWKPGLIAICVVSLLVLNTRQTVMPLSLVDIKANHEKHQSLFQQGDLEIIPGWDNYKWMMQAKDETSKSINKLLLMNMALKAKENDQHISKLPQIVSSYLQTGKRVIVGRLYEHDRESNPWYGLADLGWSRSRIQDLLSNYCTRRITTIDDVAFDEVYNCE